MWTKPSQSPLSVALRHSMFAGSMSAMGRVPSPRLGVVTGGLWRELALSGPSFGGRFIALRRPLQSQQSQAPRFWQACQDSL